MLVEKIFSALERIQTSVRASLTRASHEYGLSPLQTQILQFILRRESSTVSQLADQLCVSKPTVSDAIASLLGKKLIKKTVSKYDARGYSIMLTAKGRHDALLLAGYAKPVSDSVKTLTEIQKQALWDALLNLMRTMESQDLIPHQRMCFSCKYFEKRAEGQASYCHLMDKALSIDELRIDCPEHINGAEGGN